MDDLCRDVLTLLRQVAPRSGACIEINLKSAYTRANLVALLFDTLEQNPCLSLSSANANLS